MVSPPTGLFLDMANVLRDRRARYETLYGIFNAMNEDQDEVDAQVLTKVMKSLLSDNENLAEIIIFLLNVFDKLEKTPLQVRGVTHLTEAYQEGQTIMQRLKTQFNKVDEPIGLIFGEAYSNVEGPESVEHTADSS